MNAKELSYLRDLHAGFALVGLIIKGDTQSYERTAYEAYKQADAMQEARVVPTGIASIKQHRAKTQEKNHD